MSGEEDIALTLSKLLNDYDAIIAVLADRIPLPDKSGLLSAFGKGPPSPPKDKETFKKCVVGFRAPLLRALKIRTNASTLAVESKEEAEQAATFLKIDYGTTSEQSRDRLKKARELRSYLQGGNEDSIVPSTKESGTVTPSTFADIRVKYVDYMTRALEGLVKPETPCNSFTRLKNLIDQTTKQETGIDIGKAIADGKKVMASPEKIDTKEVVEEAKALAANAIEGKPIGGRKRTTRRRKHQKKRVKMSRRK